jgi:hypothetical protein
MDCVQNILSGLRIGDYTDTDWDGDLLFAKFKEYVWDNERKIKTKLRMISYWIDGDNMLNTVTGGGRPETVGKSARTANLGIKLYDRFQYALPVMFLLLERGLWVLNQARSVVLHSQELNVIRYSLNNLWGPIKDRASKLRCEYITLTLIDPVAYPRVFYSAIFYIQSGDPQEKLKNFCFGLVRLVIRTPECQLADTNASSHM